MTKSPLPPGHPRAPGALAAPGQIRPMTLPERAALDENDSGNAIRILSRHSEDLLYILSRGWAVWNGTHYSFQGGDLAAFKIGTCLASMIRAEADYLKENADIPDWMAGDFLAKPSGMKAAIEINGANPMMGAKYLLRCKISSNRAKHADHCGNVERIEKALKYCRHMSSATMAMLDADPLAFVCANGQVDLWAATKYPPGRDPGPDARREWLSPVDRSKLPTRSSPVVYDPEAEAPEWDAFLELIMPDPEDRAALIRCLGYLLSGDNPEASCMVMRGGGGNGKSTLLNALNSVFGIDDGYASNCDIDMFMVTPPKPTGGHNADEMDLPGARIMIGTEPAPTDTFSLKKIKALTGGDVRKIRAAYMPDAFKITPRAVPLLSCNRTPRIADDDPGTRRRMIFIPLKVDLKNLPADQIRPQYEVDAALTAEAPGILNRLIDGWRDYKARGGLDLPLGWVETRDKLMEDANPVAAFMDATVVEIEGERIRRSDFNRVFKAWAEEEGAATWSGRAVNNAMREADRSTIRVNGQDYWPGLAWASTAADLVERATGTRPPAPPAREPPPVPF